VTRQIARAVTAASGSIGFDEYMVTALYDPALGYYHAATTKFGRGGDFVTAPEVSPVFAWCLAARCAKVLRQVGDGDVLEFGAGSGALAAELLCELERLDAVPRRYFILELSGELRRRQIERLRARAPHLIERVEWLQALPDAGLRGVVLANEVLDAMPVQCFTLRTNEVLERRVGCSANGDLTWLEEQADPRLKARVQAIIETLPEPLPNGYFSELNPALGAWMLALSERLDQALVLIIDYGYPRREYYHPQRGQGTLLCHYKHRAHDDPFFYPGLQDISANVDFTAVAQAGAAARLKLLGYTSQAQFLLHSGIDAFSSRATNERERLQLAQQIKRLVLPGEMGERFQIMALGRNIDKPSNGFAGRDLRARL
jgi:SAM-dependent MidA family methyltransferase